MLITTLTKRMAEDLTEYYQQNGLRVRYLHSDIDTLERVGGDPRPPARQVRRARSASTCCARGSTCPEVSLVAILDADKEGYLRSATSLIQTSGRAARNVNGEVIMYADRVTGSMRRRSRETERRRVRAGRVQRRARHHPGVDPIVDPRRCSRR